MGRPSAFDHEAAGVICERLASGESLRAICRDDGFPSETTVRRWALDDVNGFSAQYARAREMQAHAVAEQAIDEATSSGGDPAQKRLAFDARKWFASKLAPKSYGDKAEVAHTGHDGGPQTIRIERVIVDPKA